MRVVDCTPLGSNLVEENTMAARKHETRDRKRETQKKRPGRGGDNRSAVYRIAFAMETLDRTSSALRALDLEIHTALESLTRAHKQLETQEAERKRRSERGGAKEAEPGGPDGRPGANGPQSWRTDMTKTTQFNPAEWMTSLEAEVAGKMAGPVTMGAPDRCRITEAAIVYRPEAGTTPRALHVTVETPASYLATLHALALGLRAIEAALEDDHGSA